MEATPETATVPLMSTRATSRFTGRGIAPGLLALLIVLPWMHTLTRGAVPGFMDIVMQAWPLRRLAAVLLHEGVAPFWNPACFGGVPLLANPQWGILYPGHWMFFLFPTAGMFSATMVGHVLLGALGVYALLRIMGCGRVAAFFGGALAAGNGWCWAHFAFVSYHAVWAWWPWQWAVLLRWLEAPRARWKRGIAALGILGALQLLAGAPQLVFYNALGCVVFLIVWAIGGRCWKDAVSGELPKPNTAVQPGSGARGQIRSRNALIIACGLFAAALLALLLSAPQWIPTRVFLGECIRAGALPESSLRGGALALRDVRAALLGGAGFPEDAETTAYFGAAGLLLALLGLGYRPRRRAVIAFAAIGLLGIMLSLRALLPLWMALLPGFSHMHDPRRALALTAAVLPILAGLGIEFLAAGRGSKKAAVRYGRGAILVLLSVLLLWAGWSAGKISYRLPYSMLGWVQALNIPLFAAGAAACGLAIVLSVRARRPAILLVLCGAVALAELWIFAARRIDLKVMPPASGDALYATLDAALNAPPSRASGESGESDPTAKIIRFFAFDPTGHYSYDYTRPDLADWGMPGFSPLTWQRAEDGTWRGLCDLQGYDPALPQRQAVFGEYANDARIRLYPRHFILYRDARHPLLKRLAPHALIGPADHYLAPLFPPELRAGEERIVPFEEPHIAFDAWTIEYAIFGKPSGGSIEITPLDARGGTLELLRLALPENAARGMLERDAPDRDTLAQCQALRIRYAAAMPEAAPIRLLVGLRRAEGAAPFVSGGGAAMAPSALDATARDSAPFSAPACFLYPAPRPYTELTRRTPLIPAGEPLERIAAQMQRDNSTCVLEWAEAALPDSFARGRADQPAGSVRILAWEPGRIELEAAVTGEGGAALVLREPYFSGWRVRVNGARARSPIPADLIHQAVWLESGTHRVVWIYHPPGWGAGLTAAGVGVLALLVLLLPWRSPRRRVV